MTIVENIITPLAMMIAYVVMGGWLLYMIYWILKKIFPNFKSSLKYKLFKKKYNEEDVKWCIDAIEKRMNVIDVKRFLLLKGTKKQKLNEILYIFNQVSRKLKGGNKK